MPVTSAPPEDEDDDECSPVFWISLRSVVTPRALPWRSRTSSHAAGLAPMTSDAVATDVIKRAVTTERAMRMYVTPVMLIKGLLLVSRLGLEEGGGEREINIYWSDKVFMRKDIKTCTGAGSEERRADCRSIYLPL